MSAHTQSEQRKKMKESKQRTENARDSHLHGAERYDNWRQWHMVIGFFLYFVATMIVEAAAAIEKDSRDDDFICTEARRGNRVFVSRAVTCSNILRLFLKNPTKKKLMVMTKHALT